MRWITVLLLVLLCSFSLPRPSSVRTLNKMYNRYHGKWQKSLRFVQHTEKYRNDSLISTETWYETIVYPDLFRIDFGEPSEGNCIIFRNDSLYRFKAHTLDKQKKEKSYLLYLIGGMYFEPSFDSVLQHLGALQYNVEKGYASKLKGRNVYVIGADKESECVNQLYIATDNFNILKSIKYDGDKKTEALFEEHIPAGGGWSETLVTFYNDGHLVQKEVYRNVVANNTFNLAIFSPANPWQWHWHKSEK